MQNKIDFSKLEVNEKGKVIKKKNTVKHSKDNALEKLEQEELYRCIDRMEIGENTKLRYKVFVGLMMDGGLRISEAIQSRSSWIIETNNGIKICVPQKDRDIRNLKRDWRPKTSAGARKVLFLNPLIGSMIKTFMISNEKGLGFSRQQGGNIIKKLGVLMKKPKLHPHALRSTYANNLIYKGINTTTLQYYMGWKDMNTAMNYIRTSEAAAETDLLNQHNAEVNNGRF